MELWYPQATKSLGNDSGSFVAGYAFKGVLHTTEGGSASGAIAAYKKANSWPHFTVDQNGKVYQHIPINKAARALENISGGVETNRGGAIQIEVVGFAAKTIWPAAQIDAMKSLMRWIEAQTGIKQIPLAFGNSSQYGLKNPLEFSPAYWKTFNGWCGHQHVPENRHWDPGAINLGILFEPVLPPIPVPPPDSSMEIDVNIQIFNYEINLDANGNGWTKVPHQIDKIIGYLPAGLRPGADGRYLTVELGFAQEDPGTIVSVAEGDPNSKVLVRLRVAV